MKLNKITFIAYIIDLYIMAICILLPFSVSYIGNSDKFEWISTVAVVAFILSFLLTFANLATAIYNFANDKKSTLKMTMIGKIALIPFFVANFYIWSCIIGGMMNPFLFLFNIVVVPFAFFVTFVYMLSTSLHNLLYFIVKYKDKRIESKDVVIIIFHFFFILDVIGSIMAYNMKEKDKIKEVTL